MDNLVMDITVFIVGTFAVALVVEAVALKFLKDRERRGGSHKKTV